MMKLVIIFCAIFCMFNVVRSENEFKKQIIVLFHNNEFDTFSEELEAAKLRSKILEFYKSENPELHRELQGLFLKYLNTRRIEDYKPHKDFMFGVLFLNQTDEEKARIAKRREQDIERTAENNLQVFIEVYLRDNTDIDN